DFLDTEPTDSWLDRVILRALPNGRISYPGPVDVAHAWAYLPDLARAAVALADKRGELGQFEDLAFDGYTLTANQMAAILSDVTGRPVQARPMSWLPIQAARPFWPKAGYLLEMRYLWQVPHRLDGTRLAALCPDLPLTPIDEALKAASSAVLKCADRCSFQSISRSTQTIR
ncbi:MAG: epimerase, partial [Roseovarius sp.]|nr:epimerase [Roseovarius sp.]